MEDFRRDVFEGWGKETNRLSDVSESIKRSLTILLESWRLVIIHFLNVF